MSHQQMKAMKLDTLKRSIVKATEENKIIDKEKLIAECGLRWGTSRRTLLEYLDILESAGFIKIVDNTIRSTKSGVKEIAEREANAYLTDFLKPEENDNGNSVSNE